MIWYMTWYMIWCDVWCDVMWYDMIWYDMIWYGYVTLVRFQSRKSSPCCPPLSLPVDLIYYISLFIYRDPSWKEISYKVMTTVKDPPHHYFTLKRTSPPTHPPLSGNRASPLCPKLRVLYPINTSSIDLTTWQDTKVISPEMSAGRHFLLQIKKNLPLRSTPQVGSTPSHLWSLQYRYSSPYWMEYPGWHSYCTYRWRALSICRKRGNLSAWATSGAVASFRASKQV